MPRHSLMQACLVFDPLDPQGRQSARNVRSAVLAFVVTYVMLLWMQGAHAQGFNELVGTMDTQTGHWFDGLAKKGQTVFTALATLEIIWCAMLWAFEKDNMGSIVGDLVKTVMTMSFFYAIMMNAPTVIPAIHAQFSSAATEQIQTPALTVDGIIGMGIKAAINVQINMINPVNIFTGAITQLVLLIEHIVRMMGTLGISTAARGGQDLIEPLVQLSMTLLWGFTGWMIGGLVSICVLICYLIIALQLVMLQIEMGLLMAAGAILLGLGGSKWTRDYVQKYLNHALVTGFRYLVLMMVLSLAVGGIEDSPWTVMENGFLALSPGNGELQAAQSAMMSSFGILFLVLVKMLLATKAPELAGALFSGGAALTAGTVSNAVMSTVGAATTVMGAPGAVVGAAEAVGKLSAVGLKGAAQSAGNQAREGLKPKPSQDSAKSL